jgi:hypothetical protein
LAEYSLDLAKMGVLLLVAEPDFFAVREKDERNIELIRVSAALSFPGAQVDAGALGFENGERTTLTVEQGIVRLPAVIERIFKADAAAMLTANQYRAEADRS